MMRFSKIQLWWEANEKVHKPLYDQEFLLKILFLLTKQDFFIVKELTMSGAQVTPKTETTIIKNRTMETSFFILRLAVCLFMTEFIPLQIVTTDSHYHYQEKMYVLTLFVVDSLTNFRKHQDPG